MKKCLFTLISIFSVLIEYFVIYLFFKIVLNKNFLISFIMTIIIFLLMAVFVAFANIVLRKGSIEDDVKPCEKEVIELIKNVEVIYNKKFYLHYVKAPQPNPAWCIGNHIYINNEYFCDIEFLPGVVAHELGHAISGISHLIFIPSLKVSTMLSRILHLTIIAMYNSKSKFINYLSYLFAVPYYIINLNNIIFTYHFLREDEITANTICIKLGYGDYLRSYYGLCLKFEDDSFLKYCDFYHPSLIEMINNMNKVMNIKDELKDIYYIKNKLILANIATKTFNVPKFITYLGFDSLNNKDLVKVSSKNVLKVHPNCFKNNRKLEEINLPNLEEFNVNSINRLDCLKNIRINNLSILENIYNTYPNRLFSNKIYKTLVLNNVIQEKK